MEKELSQLHLKRLPGMEPCRPSTTEQQLQDPSSASWESPTCRGGDGVTPPRTAPRLGAEETLPCLSSKAMEAALVTSGTFNGSLSQLFPTNMARRGGTLKQTQGELYSCPSVVPQFS